MKKQKILNWIITILFLVALIICYFFWGCRLDLIVTIIAVFVAAFSITLLSIQNKKLKEAGAEEQ